MDNTNNSGEMLRACMEALSSLGLSCGSAGNASLRREGDMLITPSGIKPQLLKATDMVPLTLQGQVLRNHSLTPSSEWRFHAAIFRQREDINAIVHCHSHYATALACSGREIPAFHYMVASAGGNNIRCAPYAIFGSQELSDHVVTALQGRRACLLANHGQISLGEGLEQALDLALEVENLAKTYTLCREDGALEILNEDEMKAVLERFRRYGQQQDL